MNNKEIKIRHVKQYEELTFTDDFMFCKIMTTYPNLCHELIELIIGRKLGDFKVLNDQKPIKITSDGKGVRFDIYGETDKNTVFDCEMQTTNNRNLPKRSRYYQGMIDLNLIEKGADYNELKRSYVIFICPFDVFEKGLHKYTFENTCIEIPELRLGDETSKIFLCAGGTSKDVSDDMIDFLEWLIGKEGKSQLVTELDYAVRKAIEHEEWKVEYLSLLMRDNEMRNAGRAEGIQEGLQEGRILAYVELVRNLMNSESINMDTAFERLRIFDDNDRTAIANALQDI